jgi:hypothetical protein
MLAGASAATSTVISTGGYDACAPRTSVRAHVRVRAPVQVHPLPDAAVGVSPAGTWSRIVIVLPSVGSSLTFVTVNVSRFPVCPRANCAGWVAEISSGCGTIVNGEGGVPARTSGTYGTGATICGIGSPDETARSATTFPLSSSTLKQ